MSDRFVLDSFALLALLRDEPGGAAVHDLIERAIAGECILLMSTINFGEVMCNTERRQGAPRAREALAMIEALPIRMVSATRVRVLAAAHLKANHRIAYADAFAAALTAEFGATLVTGDPELRALAPALAIAWLGPA